MYRDLQPACTCWWGPPWASCWLTAAGKPAAGPPRGRIEPREPRERRHTACMPVAH